MVATRSIVIFVLTVSFFTFVAFFGRLPALRSSPIGFLHRLIWRYIPKQFSRLDETLTKGRLSRAASRLYRYVLYEKHPLVLVFFLTLLTGGSSLFVYEAWQYLPTRHHILIIILVPLPYIFLFLCNRTTASSPHIITRESHTTHMMHYPYDYQLFHPNIMCRTCMFPKPARSKHCSLCRACVARADHHCIWVNNCLGRGNYKYFLALLLSTSVLLAYGAFLAYLTLAPQIRAHFDSYPHWHVSDYAGRTDFLGRVVFRLDTWLDVLATAFDVGGICRGGVGFLALLTSPLPAGLLAYHVYLVWAGMTTNESGKWSDWKEDVADNLVWSTDVYPHGQPYEQPWAKWPKRSGTFLVLTNDGREPRLVAEEITSVVAGGEKANWRRVYSMKDLVNIYDLGMWENMWESLTN